MANRSIAFPITEYARAPNQRLNEVRLRAISLLSQPNVPVHRFTLCGYQTDTEPQQSIVTDRIIWIRDLLIYTNNLQHLRIRTESEVALPILTALELWPKLYKLNVPGIGLSSYLEDSKIQCLTLRLQPHDGDLDIVPALPLLNRLKIEFISPTGESDEPFNTRLNFAQYPRLKWFKLCENAHSTS